MSGDDIELLRLPAPKEEHAQVEQGPQGLRGGKKKNPRQGKGRKNRAGANWEKPRNGKTIEGEAAASDNDPDLARLLAEREGQTQLCNRCGAPKPYTEFYLKREAGKPLFRLVCKECCKTQAIGLTANALAVNFKFDKGLERKVGKNFTSLVLKRRALFRCDALDALHDLAMMDCEGNPQLAAWKFQAAQFLAGGISEDGSTSNELTATLAMLDKAYRENAPRIKATRERLTIEFEGREEKLVQ